MLDVGANRSIKILFSLAVVWLPALTAMAQMKTTAPTPAIVKKSTFDWKFKVDGESFSNENGEKYEIGGLNLYGKINYRLIDEALQFHGLGLVSLVGGRSLARFGDDVPDTGIWLKEALIDWKPLSFFILHGGVVNQAYLQAPLLISSRGLPGALEELTFPGDLASLNIRAEQTIPTSKSLSTHAVDQEETPNFFAETLSLKTRISKAVDSEIYGSHYMFRNLPSQVAFDSAVYGNTVAEQGTATARFAYDFNGWLAGINGNIQFSKGAKFKTGFQWLQNASAPTAFKDGQILFAESEFSVSDALALAPRVENFYNESDTSPAFYNDSDYGHNNRQGFGGQLDLIFKKSGFKIGGQYIDADVINPSRNQSRQQYFMIRLETDYERI